MMSSNSTIQSVGVVLAQYSTSLLAMAHGTFSHLFNSMCSVIHSAVSTKRRAAVIGVFLIGAYWLFKKRSKKAKPVYTSLHTEFRDDWGYVNWDCMDWDYGEGYGGDYSAQVMSSSGITNHSSAKKKRSKKQIDRRNILRENNSRRPNDKRNSPNYFVAIPVTNKAIRLKIQDIQRSILEHNEILKHWFVSPKTLHLTLAVFKIETDEQLENAMAALDCCYEEMWARGIDNPFLNIHGVDTFSDQVLYAAVSRGRRGSGSKPLREIADIVSSVFESYGLPVWRGKNEDPSFNPHITIMKTSNAFWLKKKGITGIEPFLYEDFTDVFMGSQRVNQLQLCAMHKPKNKRTGYYHIQHAINLTHKK